MTPPSETRQRIVEAALDLFHAQGVKATGLDQILTTAGAGKGQFYHYFASKDALLLDVLKEFRRRLAAGELPVPSELRSVDDLAGWFGFFLQTQREMGWERSCPIGTIAAEFGEDQAELRDEARAIFDDARGVLVRFFESLRERGELRDGVEPAALADFCYTVMQGGLLVSKIERHGDGFERAVQQALAHVRAQLA